MTTEQPARLSARDACRAELIQLASSDATVWCLDSDMGGLETGFGEAHPDRYLNVGIAEANLMGVAAGMAASGLRPFVHTMASFASLRATEQIKIDIADNGLPVRIVATHAGLSAGLYGPTHQAVQDLAVMRGIVGMEVVVPADATQARALLRQADQRPGPVYIRLGRDASPDIEPAAGGSSEVRWGEAQLLRAGSDYVVVCLGPPPTLAALEAAEQLASEGVSVRVVNMHTLVPLDRDAVREAAQTKGIVTIEDHLRSGGLGGAVAEVVAEEGGCRVHRIGIPARLIDTVGDQDALLEHCGIGAAAIVEQIRRWVER